MEEKGQSSSCAGVSEWKLRQQSLRNQRNERQLQNRLVILQMERQAKVKSIERKLEAHRRMMEVRMDRFRLKQDIQQHDHSLTDQAGTNSRLFRDTRIHRATNIRARSSQFRDTNHRLFQEAKQERARNEQRIREHNDREALLKTEKRNRVRLIEIESKENINKFWRSRLGDLKEARREDMQGRLRQEQKKLEGILQLERSEQELLDEIKRTEEMEMQLNSMMEEERSMVLTAISASHTFNATHTLNASHTLNS